MHEPQVKMKNMITSFKGMTIPFEKIDPMKIDFIQKSSHRVVKKDIKSSHTAGLELIIKMT